MKAAIDAGIDVAVGTEIPDTYAGNSNPLIVAQYLDSSNNSDYGGAEGVILIRKYVDPIGQVYNENANSIDYSRSLVSEFLATTYYDNCTNEVKSLISQIDLKRDVVMTVKWFLMSPREMCYLNSYSQTIGNVQGFMWDYWKEKTGLTSPSDGSNKARVLKSSDGVGRYVWLSARYSNSAVCMTDNVGGQLNADSPTTSRGILPACFVAKN